MQEKILDIGDLNFFFFFNLFGPISDFWGFYEIFFFLFFLHIFFKFLRLPLKITNVTTGHQKWPKMGQKKHIISFFFAKRLKDALAEDRRPPLQIKVGPCSGPYLLV